MQLNVFLAKMGDMLVSVNSKKRQMDYYSILAFYQSVKYEPAKLKFQIVT